MAIGVIYVRDVMTHHPATVNPSAKLDDAVRLMAQVYCRHLPVVDGDRIVGIVSNTDAVRQEGLGKTVADVMTPNPLTVSPNDPIEFAAALMAVHKINSLLVEHEGLYGIVTTYDMLDALANSMRMWRESAFRFTGDEDLVHLIEQGATAVRWEGEEGEEGEAPSVGAVLLRTGVVTPEELRELEAKSVTSDVPVEELLIREGQADLAEIERARKSVRQRLSLTNLLHADGALNAEGLAKYQALRRLHPEASIRKLLLENGLASEEAFLRVVGEKHGHAFMAPTDLTLSMIDRALLQQISRPYMRHHQVLPIAKVEGRLRAAFVDPLDDEAARMLTILFRCSVDRCSTLERHLIALLDRLDSEGEQKNPQASLLTVDSKPEEHRLAGIRTAVGRLPRGQRTQWNRKPTVRPLRAAIEGDGDEQDAVLCIDNLITQAVHLGASDVHFDPLEDSTLVRFRIDGELEPISELDPDLAQRVTARLKVLAGADIAQRRMHQDGRAVASVAGRPIQIRFSSYVSINGEAVVLRLLDNTKGLVPIEKLEFSETALEEIDMYAIQAASGVIALAGPTGSGKTTTMFSLVDRIRSPNIKIISCEDPVEYRLEGAIQSSVAKERTFAQSLRAVMRQDPDIIIVGEIRDSETAGLACEAGLTGHKVFSTLHADETVGALIRLIDTGVEPFVLASSLSLIIGQRLVRRICDGCSQRVAPDDATLRLIGTSSDALVGCDLRQGRGCSACRNTGYRGRLGLHEVLVITDDLRLAMLARASTHELRRIARTNPRFITLREDGILKAIRGQTTLTEVIAGTPRTEDQRSIRDLRAQSETKKRTQ